MEIDQLLSFLGAILGGGIIGAIISALATIFYGERRVETLRRRREHSIKLNDEVLKKWLEKIGDYSKLGAIYSPDIDKMVGVEVKDPSDLDFFDAAKRHLDSKYPDAVKAWDELKYTISEYNDEFATFLEEIRKLAIKELQMPCYYSNLPRRAPKEHITIDRFAESIRLEMEFRLGTKDRWNFG